MLVAGTWIIRGTLFIGNGGILQEFGSVQEILFLEVALTESWVICEHLCTPRGLFCRVACLLMIAFFGVVVTRLAQERGTPNVFPSIQLILAVFGVDIL